MNNKGFLLIEMMITAAITLTITMAIMSMISFSINSQMNINSLSDYNNLQDEIKMFISNPTLCGQSFQTVINNKSFNLAGQIIAPGVKLTSGSTINTVDLSLIAPTLNANEYSAYLNLSGTKNAVSAGPALLKPVSIPLTVTINPITKDIVSCSLNSAANVNPIASPIPLFFGPAECAGIGGVWTQEGNSNNYTCKM